MSTGRCYIVGAGSFDGFQDQRPTENDYIIAADGGYNYLLREGIVPDALLGDFDSLIIVPEHKNLIRHSPIKDDTDMALAVEYGISMGYTEFYLFGGLGGRLDHSLANTQLLAGLAKRKIPAYLIGEGIILTAITEEGLQFPAVAKGMISVFCMGDKAEQVYEKGLKYELENAVLTYDRALGVSNEFTGQDAVICVGQGTLLISWNRENGVPVRIQHSDN